MQANILRAQMMLHNITQADLAKACRMSENTFSNKINGRSSFNTDEIQIICDVLQIDDPKLKVEIFLTESSQ